MIRLAVGLLLLAGVAHATWNVLLKDEGDPFALATLAAITSAVVWLPLVIAGWLFTGHPGLPLEAWVLMTISAALEALYFLSLSRAYETGEISVVYPTARGTAPVLAVLVGLIVLSEGVTAFQLAGILWLLLGIWLVRRPSGFGRSILPALLTGITIAAYSAVDSVGVHTTAAWFYGFGVWVLTAAFLSLLSLVRQRLHHIPPRNNETIGLGRATATGMLMTSTYLIVLVALRIAPLAIVAPLRESAIVFVMIWGVWKLGERNDLGLRVAGGLSVALGACLIAFA